ncbi:hypothetical protein N7490_003771 [Penicillium lividum]|nr:hypothetical protein N7490_003771 [Penicillium lividum]
MTSEPSEEAITEFISFTSTTRPRAINFLKAHNGDSQKAINAYYEDPTGPHSPSTSWQNESNLTPFGYNDQEHGPRMPATAPPSRPPSRVNMHDTAKAAGNDGPTAINTSGNSAPTGTEPGLSLAEREEQELQRAVAMSLNQGMGTQETGVTTAVPDSPPHFGKATRDHYNEGDWAMTLFNETSQEVTLSPDCEDRKRVNGEPAFIRPSQDNLYLGGFLTILHEIPMAREALLLRNKLLFDYGLDTQWWNGQPINLPKIVTVHDGRGDSDWEDLIHETQRLMAFLDSTERAFGSSDALAGLKQMNWLSSDSEEAVARFLETWNSAAVRAEPNNPLVATFVSRAFKKTPFEDGDEPISKELFVFEPAVEIPGQTLYDVLDTAIWSDKPGEDLDDVWLEHVGEILVMKLDSSEKAKPVDVKIPAVFYPDRYLSTCQDVARDMRVKKLEAEEAVSKIEQQIEHFTSPPNPLSGLTRMDILEKTAAAVPLALKTALDGNLGKLTPEEARERAERIPQQLRALAAKIDEKLKGLEIQKQKALETMHSYSRMLTEPSESPQESPSHKYTIRGVCTEPHITYVLKGYEAKEEGDVMDVDGKDCPQWWRISFSAEDGKTRQAEKRQAQGDESTPHNGDVIGYTARKVSESEVLRAASEDWKSVLLVYASDAALNAPVDPAPLQLQDFVNKDNEAFAAECSQDTSNSDDSWNQPTWNQKAMEEQARPPTPQQDRVVNVFDYEVQDFDGEKREQEMQEKTGSWSATQSLSQAIDDNDMWRVESDEDMADHVEHASSN